MPITPYLEFESFNPSAINLQRIGQRLSGNGQWGFYVDPTISLTHPAYVKTILGPEDKYLHELKSRLEDVPYHRRAMDWSGWFIKRQLLAGCNEPINPSDKLYDLSPPRQITDKVRAMSSGQVPFCINYVNEETFMANGQPACTPDIRASLISSLITDMGPVMATQVSCGIWPLREWWGEMPRISPSYFSPNGLRPMLDAWINTRVYDASWTLSPAWNGMIETINDALSMIHAVDNTETRPVLNIRGILDIDNRISTPHEQGVYRTQIQILGLIGIRQAIVFNQGGRGAHLKDPATDFAAMANEDTQTLEAFHHDPLPTADYNTLPKEPFPHDSPEITIAGYTFTYAALPQP
jgi:hypothetical protein